MRHFTSAGCVFPQPNGLGSTQVQIIYWLSTDSEAVDKRGTYTSTSYGAPLIGGWSDREGQRGTERDRDTHKDGEREREGEGR